MKVKMTDVCTSGAKRSIPSAVAFKSMKVSQFEGFDYSCIRQHKAPIEKFNGMNDFYNWAFEHMKKKLSKKMIGKSPETESKRCDILNKWQNGVRNYSPAVALISIASIIKDLKNSNDNLPPVFHSSVFEETVADIEGALALEPEFQFDMSKIYKKHLKAKFVSTGNEGVVRNGWVTVPSTAEDSDIEKNAELLNTISYKMWCTKGVQGKVYLKNFSFRIYIENGLPQICIRLLNNTVHEIQGRLNDSRIPDEYKRMVEDYIEENRFRIDCDTEDDLYGVD